MGAQRSGTRENTGQNGRSGAADSRGGFQGEIGGCVCVGGGGLERTLARMEDQAQQIAGAASKVR